MEYPKGYVEGLPNCGIVAIAALTEHPYEYVWEWFKWRENRAPQWKGRTYRTNYLDALSHMGYKNSYEIENLVKPMPLHIWNRVYGKKNPEARFLVCSSGHTMALHKGIVLDQSGIGPVNEHRSKGRRINYAIVLEK